MATSVERPTEHLGKLHVDGSVCRSEGEDVPARRAGADAERADERCPDGVGLVGQRGVAEDDGHAAAGLGRSRDAVLAGLKREALVNVCGAAGVDRHCTNIGGSGDC